MKLSPRHKPSFLLSLFLIRLSSAADPCQSFYPCQSNAFYRAGADPSLLDLPSIGDLFGLSRLAIARASNLTDYAISVNQPLLLPLTCGCHSNLSYSPAIYRIATADTYYTVSSFKFVNLTSYPVVIKVNPSLVPTNLDVGTDIVFPLFCQCPTAARSGIVAIITYSFQVGDTFAKIASEFDTDVQSLVSLNGKEDSVQPYLTVLIPVPRLPPPVLLSHATVPPPPMPRSFLAFRNRSREPLHPPTVGIRPTKSSQLQPTSVHPCTDPH